jgi:DNA (cytosine-5)-methyltransferase 1
MLTHGSLFAGIGGFDLGFERAGIKTVWQVEIDDYCRRVLAKHWPDAQRFSDIRECGKHNLPWVDILSGGFPCQDISNAGKRAGIDGERSGLWSEYARIICELRPRFVVVENVAALLNRGMERVLGDLAQIGYDAEWQSIRASDVGAPHRRERIWIVAYPGSTLLAYPRCQHFDVQQPLPRVYEPSGSGEVAVSISDRGGCGRPHNSVQIDRPVIFRGWNALDDAGTMGVSESVPHDDGTGFAQLQRQRSTAWSSGRTIPYADAWWEIEPGVDRVADGIPDVVDRLRGLGNAVVPQIAEWIGRRIVEVGHGRD